MICQKDSLISECATGAAGIVHDGGNVPSIRLFADNGVLTAGVTTDNYGQVKKTFTFLFRELLCLGFMK